MNRYIDVDKNRTTHGQSLYRTVIFGSDEIFYSDFIDEAINNLCKGKGRCKRCSKNNLHTCTHIVSPCRCSFHSFLFTLEDNITNDDGVRQAWRLLSNGRDIGDLVAFVNRLDKCSHIKNIGRLLIYI